MGDNYSTWQTVAEDAGYKTIQPRKGNYMYTKNMVSEENVQNLMMNTALELVKGENVTEDIKADIEAYVEQIKNIGTTL